MLPKSPVKVPKVPKGNPPPKGKNRGDIQDSRSLKK